MARTITIYIDDETEARILHAQAHVDACDGASFEWMVAALVSEGALNYARKLRDDPADWLAAQGPP